MTSHQDDINGMANAIVARHRPLLGLPDIDEAPPLPAFDEPVHLAALQACTALGFSGIDALCVAAAWRRQVHRLGRFDPTHWPAEPDDFELPAWPRAQAFAPLVQPLGLYAVLPDAAWVGRMARAGVSTVQLRFKSTDTMAVRAEVRAAVAAVQGTGAQLFINDHWREALSAGAYGVHLGQEDLALMEPGDWAALRSAGLRLGLSSHGYAEMRRADALSPSYIALGAVYPTTLKAMATVPQGPGRLAAYVRLLRSAAPRCPLVAIGGIDRARLPDVLASGVGSVAVVRALLAAGEPEAEAAMWSADIASAPWFPAQA